MEGVSKVLILGKRLGNAAVLYPITGHQANFGWSSGFLTAALLEAYLDLLHKERGAAQFVGIANRSTQVIGV